MAGTICEQQQTTIIKNNQEQPRTPTTPYHMSVGRSPDLSATMWQAFQQVAIAVVAFAVIIVIVVVGVVVIIFIFAVVIVVVAETAKRRRTQASNP